MSDQLSKATHQGELHIGGKILPCAVLKGGERVITEKSVFDAFERPRRGQRQQDKRINLPSFMAANNLLPYITQDVNEWITPIKYRGLDGREKSGYRAELLPAMCDIYLAARKDNTLTSRQKKLGEISEMIVRALSKVGIIALVDEATGYQEIRDKKALAAILDKYLRKELAAWAKKFPDEFYKEMFRLRDWNWSFLKRPAYVGKLTNDVIYERITPGLLEELKKRSPKNEDGKRKGTLQQLFTDDIGDPALAQHLHAVTGLMRAASNWDGFYRLLQRAFPKKNDQLPLLLED